MTINSRCRNGGIFLAFLRRFNILTTVNIVLRRLLIVVGDVLHEMGEETHAL